MEKIKRKLGYLEFKVGNIFNYPVAENKFSKIYLSNACITYNPDEADWRATYRATQKLLSLLREPGLIYASNSSPFKLCLTEGIVIDLKLSGIAVKHEKIFWAPAV